MVPKETSGSEESRVRGIVAEPSFDKAKHSRRDIRYFPRTPKPTLNCHLFCLLTGLDENLHSYICTQGTLLDDGMIVSKVIGTSRPRTFRRFVIRVEFDTRTSQAKPNPPVFFEKCKKSLISRCLLRLLFCEIEIRVHTTKG